MNCYALLRKHDGEYYTIYDHLYSRVKYSFDRFVDDFDKFNQKIGHLYVFVAPWFAKHFLDNKLFYANILNPVIVECEVLGEWPKSIKSHFGNFKELPPGAIMPAKIKLVREIWRKNEFKKTTERANAMG